MSKKPLLSEGTARRWAKYAGIQNESKTLLSEMYKNEAVYNEEALEEEALEEEALEEEALEEAAIIAELEEMLAEQDEDMEDEEDEEEDLGMDPLDDEGEPEEGDEDEDMEDEEEDELDVDAEEAEADEAAMMSQEDVEAALKAGLEAMASAVADALKIKIDVRSGDEGEEGVLEMDHPMEEGEHEMEEGMHPEMEEGMHPEKEMEEGAYGMKYEGIDRDELVERVMKRVAARLVKESKEG